MTIELPPLPDHRYVPGQTERHAENAFDPIRDRALGQTRTETARENPAWLYGLRLFNGAFWWEAHEVLEVVWMNARPNSAERAMTQAVIQLANAALKREMKMDKAWLRLGKMALDLSTEATRRQSAPMGLRLQDIETAIAELQSNQQPCLPAP